VQVPDDLLAEADRIAASLGVDRAIVLGDLVAAALPEALAEAAEDLVGHQAKRRLRGHLSHETAMLPAATESTTNVPDHLHDVQDQPSVPARSSDVKEPESGAPPT
jgi:hypothetical protein